MAPKFKMVGGNIIAVPQPAAPTVSLFAAFVAATPARATLPPARMIKLVDYPKTA